MFRITESGANGISASSVIGHSTDPSPSAAIKLAETHGGPLVKKR
jgi:hypothetical protein